MSEHTALRDRLERALQAMGGPGSPHLTERAEEFVSSLSEPGYSQWLRCVCEVSEVLPHWFAPGVEIAEADYIPFSQLSSETQAILFLAADCIQSSPLSREQQVLLAILRNEQEIPPDPTLDLHDRQLLAELWLAKALDECDRQADNST